MSSAIHFFSLSCKPRNPILSTNSSFSTQSTLVTLRSLCFFATLTHSVFFKGCLSMINVERPIRQSVICMARRYAPNSRLRKMKSRKRGGDPEKKRTRKRKRKRTGKRKGRGETRKKKNVKVIRLASSAGTGFFYAKKKNTKNMKKLDIKKYDPTIKRHVKFAEVKMK